MDYETIVYGYNCCNQKPCYVDCHEDLGWDQGEITELAIPIFGGFTLDDETFISVGDFMEGSSTKSVKLDLRDHFGEKVDSQVIFANSPDLEYHKDHLCCYYQVDEKLSNKLAPGSYSLQVYIQNVIPGVDEKLPERTIFNKMVTRPEGLEITIS